MYLAQSNLNIIGVNDIDCKNTDLSILLLFGKYRGESEGDESRLVKYWDLVII